MLLAAAIGVVTSALAHGQPTVTLLDTQGNVGHNAAVAIGTDGLALIAYSDPSHSALKTAHCNDAACTSATLSTVDTSGAGAAGSIAIGADGLGIMVWDDGSYGHTGTVENARSMVVHRPDGVTWAVLVDGNAPSETDRIEALLDKALASVPGLGH